MIHDLLLSCLNLNSTQLPLMELIASDAVTKFLHPCEEKILNDIVDIINLLREIARFTKTYGSNESTISLPTLQASDDNLPSGLYLKAFANGIDSVLDEYYNEVTELERRYLQNPSHSLLFLFQQLQVYEPVGLFLRKLIRGISTQKLHGCAIIQYLHQNTQHGDARICRAIKIIIAAVNVVFLNQLTHWILYAKLIDNHGEFFIQSSETLQNCGLDSERNTSGSSGRQTVTTISENVSTYTDIWQYEICQDFLPHYFTSSWSEKVLFIGQTVLIFKVDVNKNEIHARNWQDEQTLWNENEHIYFSKLQALLQYDNFNVSQYERVIDEIKSYVTARLSELAVNQADLLQQLRLIKDFYLLGRGELFLEFIRQTCSINKHQEHAQRLREYVKAFESSAHGVGVTEELEKFSLSWNRLNTDSVENISMRSVQITDTAHDFSCLQLLYKINWPLHLLFSPRVIERYNELFRFLLLIKRLQYQLHSVWSLQTRYAKMQFLQGGVVQHQHVIQVMHFRNQLMFFIDNLQYYIQVDVLESQFSILLNTVLNKADFEQIQRAHSVFQANVLSLCFLLTDEDSVKDHTMSCTNIQSQNPVFLVINDMFQVCEDFYVSVRLDTEHEPAEISKKMNGMEISFGKLVEQLMDLLNVLKTAPTSTTPLSQLLLRLDFNRWFSDKRKAQK